MVAKVWPLGRTEIDWPTLLGVAKEALGRVVSRGVDREGKSTTTKNTQDYLTILGEIKGNTNLANPGQTLQHIHYSFLAISTPKALYELIQQSSIKAHISPTTNSLLSLGILSGSLEDWRTAIINCTNSSNDTDLRELMDRCLEAFEREGLGRCWSGYKKVNLPDGTYKLLEK